MNMFFSTLMLGLLFGVTQQVGVTQQDHKNADSNAETPKTPVYTYRVIQEFPHDRHAFTQGLVWENGILYEGTGLFGESELRLVDLETGRVIRRHAIEDRFFGEGITIWKDRVIQLTWLSRTGFVYNKDTFEELRRFSYPWQGWGITHDGSQLILSDGTDTLHFLDPDTFALLHEIRVTDQGTPVRLLNELEFIQGEVYANVWMSDRIARIDPVNGRVNSWIDLSGLFQPDGSLPEPDVLNGIAYDPENRRLWVTGKRWDTLFEIDVFPQQQSKVDHWKIQQ